MRPALSLTGRRICCCCCCCWAGWSAGFSARCKAANRCCWSERMGSCRVALLLLLLLVGSTDGPSATSQSFRLLYRNGIRRLRERRYPAHPVCFKRAVYHIFLSELLLLPSPIVVLMGQTIVGVGSCSNPTNSENQCLLLYNAMNIAI